MKKSIAILLSLLVLPTFATLEKDQKADFVTTEGGVWSPGRFRREFYGEDKWEGFNRSMFFITDVTLTYVAEPISTLYTSIVPKPLGKGINNALKNSTYPGRLLANLGTAEWLGAWDETKRFLINTTYGVLGLFDPAKNVYGIASTDATFAGTFETWGMKPGPMIAIPFSPYTNVRDNCGYAIDLCLDPKNYIDYAFPTGIWISWTAALWPTYAPVWERPWDTVIEPRYDHYREFMPLMSVKAELQRHKIGYWAHQAAKYGMLEDVRPPIREEFERPENLQGKWVKIEGYNPRTPAMDTLRTSIFAPEKNNDFWWDRSSIWCRDFAKSVSERSAQIEGSEYEAHYGFVEAPTDAAKERLVFIIPGITGNHNTDATIAMAEMMHKCGASVVLCDDIFHWDYVRSANLGILPGNLKEDAKRYAAFMNKVYADLKEKDYVDEPEVVILGWSMGALTTCHLASLEESAALQFPVKKYVAINTPVDFNSALKAIDDYFKVVDGWSRERLREACTSSAGAIYAWSDGEHPRYVADQGHPNVSEEDARFAIAVTFSMPLAEDVALVHEAKPLPFFKEKYSFSERHLLYEEIGKTTYMDYIHKFLPVFYPEMTGEDLLKVASLASIEDALKNNEKIVMLHNWDDFILAPSDREYLDSIMLSRLTWFSSGAHCANFYTREFEEEILKRVGFVVAE